MGKFCEKCGRPLQEGEVCNCVSGVQSQQGEKSVVPRLLVPIGQTVVGGVLFIYGLSTLDWAWGEMSIITSVGFLLTGICSLIELKK